MKISCPTQNALLTLILLACVTIARAQSITGTVLTQPCNNNGQLGVTVTGLTPPINYAYYNLNTNFSVTHNNINSLSDILSGVPAYQAIWNNPNFWTIYAYNGSGTVSINLQVTPPFTDSVKVTPGICPAQSTLEALFFVGGTPPFSCVWTNASTSINYSGNPAAVPGGLYSAVISDAAGCIVSAPSTGSTSISVYNITSMNVAINGSSANCTNGTATCTATGGSLPYSYLWSNNASTQSLSGLSMGQLSCLVTDAQGCTSQGFYSVQQAVNINVNTTITNATCVQNNGAIMTFVTGGTAPYTYLWSNSATTANINGLAGGSYNLTVTDANGCMGSAFPYVNASTPVSVTYNSTASSCTAPTGAATVFPTGGASPYSVVWYLSPSFTTGNSINSMPAGNYNFKVTDANGCINTGAVTIPPVSPIVANINAAPVMCPATTGAINTSASTGNPPLSYTWSNGSNANSISGVPLGNYSVIIKDNVGCSVTKYATLAQISPVQIGLSTIPVTCLYATNGAITAVASGGTSPYTYLWSNNQTSNTIIGLGTGYYNVTAKDANNCISSAAVYVPNSGASTACYCTITGTVYTDTNLNCVRNSGEAGIPNVQIHCSGYGYAYTDANGVYSFQVPSGTYTIAETVQYIYPLASCQSNNQVVNVTAAANCVSTVDFANNTLPLHDIRVITTNVNLPIPGNSYTQKIIIQNDGTLPESSITLGYVHDGQLGYNNATSFPFTQPNSGSYPNWYRANAGLPTLLPGTFAATNVNYNVPTNIPLNTAVDFYDTTAYSSPISTSWLADNTPWNNVNYLQTNVVGSYDPNFKEVSPRGEGPQGEITYNDSILSYVVHFQNTGSYYAREIVVVDTLDADLRLATVRPGYADHTYKATVSDNGVLKFTFSNINLPWQSSFGDVMSSGMLTYSVKTKRNLAVGTQIKNKAAIYFDYNKPVITNSTINTIVIRDVSVAENRAETRQGLLYPNPAKTMFNLVFTGNSDTQGVLTVSDISGRMLSEREIDVQAGENRVAENIGQLQNGIYLVQMKSGEQTISLKLVIAK